MYVSLHWSCNIADRAPKMLAANAVGSRSLSAMPHPDLASERARLRFAQECLDLMRRRTAARVANEDVLAANEADAEAVKWQLQRRLASLDDDAAVLCFGRIDEETGDRWYIGRRHVEDDAGAPIVVD